jgi:nitrite reductase (NADH) small subunit
MTTNWKHVGPVEKIPLQGARRLCLKSAGKPVAIFRAGDGEIFALIDECPHKRGPLSEGIISGHSVTCPLHNWVIGLEDGMAVAPDEGSAKPLSVRVVDGEVYIHLPELVAGEMV